jgi:hypothetical protein
VERRPERIAHRPEVRQLIAAPSPIRRSLPGVGRAPPISAMEDNASAQEDIELGGGESQQFPILDSCPSDALNGGHVVSN